MLTNPFFWQALSFSGIAIGLVGGSAWWLYRSPLATPVGKVARPSAQQSSLIALGLGLAGLQFVGGGLWDASQHLLTGEVPGGADFLWPPHIMLYSGFLITLLVALAGLRLIALTARRAGFNDPRQWVRRNPYLGTVVLASLYGLLAIPGDAIWHALFGLDLTAWSPPHLLLGVMIAVVNISAAALLAQRRAALPHRPVNLALAALLGIGLNVLQMVGVLEWELPGTFTDTVVGNPIWVYPVVGGSLAFIVLILAKQLIDSRWAATVTILAFFSVRGLVSIALGFTDQIIPFLPLMFLMGAIAVDWFPWSRITAPLLRNVLITFAFTAGYLWVALLVLAGRPDLPAFTQTESWLAAIVVFVVCLGLLPLAQWLGLRLVGLKSESA